jgi:hypothetical protein
MKSAESSEENTISTRKQQILRKKTRLIHENSSFFGRKHEYHTKTADSSEENTNITRKQQFLRKKTRISHENCRFFGRKQMTNTGKQHILRKKTDDGYMNKAYSSSEEHRLIHENR